MLSMALRKFSLDVFVHQHTSSHQSRSKLKNVSLRAAAPRKKIPFWCSACKVVSSAAASDWNEPARTKTHSTRVVLRLFVHITHTTLLEFSCKSTVLYTNASAAEKDFLTRARKFSFFSVREQMEILMDTPVLCLCCSCRSSQIGWRRRTKEGKLEKMKEIKNCCRELRGAA